MNGPHTPTFRRDNIATRLAERVAAQNAADGKPAGRMLEQMSNAAPLIPANKVRRMSPAEQRRTDFVPEPEDPRVAMQSSARAAALGISNDGRVNNDGEPTDAEIDAMLRNATGTIVPGAATAGEGAAAPGFGSSPEAAQRAVTLPRGQAPVGLAGNRSMPNFANVEGFDLMRKVAVVDGMEFKLAEVDVVAMKKFAIQVVLDNVTYQLAQALVALGIPQEMADATAAKMRETAAAGATPGGMSGPREGANAGATERMQEVRPDEATRAVLPGQEEQGRTDIAVPAVRDGVQSVPGEAGGNTQVPPNPEGNSGPPPQSSGKSWAFDDALSLLGDGEATPT